MSLLEGTVQKSFNKKIFSLSAIFIKQADAKKEASRIRKNGFEVRVTKEARVGFGDNIQVFKVWRWDPRFF